MNDFISVVGMYNFSPDLFDNMHVPAALDNKEDRETLIDNLVSECAELELLYLNPDFLAIMIERWSRKRLPIWEKLYLTTQYEYDPISNYDRTEESTDVLDSDGRRHGTTSGETDATNTGKVAGFDSPSQVPRSEENAHGNTSAEFDEQDSRDETRKHNLRAYGNIGVTTTQEMIQQERDIVNFTVIDVIIQDFKDRFCIQLY